MQSTSNSTILGLYSYPRPYPQKREHILHQRQFGRGGGGGQDLVGGGGMVHGHASPVKKDKINTNRLSMLNCGAAIVQT